MEHSPCDDPLCNECNELLSTNSYLEILQNKRNSRICNNCHSTSNFESLQDGQTGCTPCLGTGNEEAPIVCSLLALETMGVIADIDLINDTINFTAPDGVTLSLPSLQNAINRFNQQLPTGSLKGYISSIFTNLGSSLSTNAKESLGVILGTVFLIAFVLFTIICITLIAYKVIDIAVGISLILIGLFFSLLAFLLAFSEAYNLGANFEQSFFNSINPVLETLACALVSGTCCYSGASCCCPTNPQALCGM
jgi:hypothetical protein